MSTLHIRTDVSFGADELWHMKQTETMYNIANSKVFNGILDCVRHVQFFSINHPSAEQQL